MRNQTAAPYVQIDTLIHLNCETHENPHLCEILEWLPVGSCLCADKGRQKKARVGTERGRRVLFGKPHLENNEYNS